MASGTRNSLIAAGLILLSFMVAQAQVDLPAGPGRTPSGGTILKSYAPYPSPEVGYVTDRAGLLTDQQKEYLNACCYTTEKETGVEVVVVVINSMRDYPGTANSSIESFAKGLFDTYGIGNMPRNDGVLLVVARQDRKVRIELGAHYGRSRDSDAMRIIDEKILPCFRKDDYAGGITSGTEAIIHEFAGLRIALPWTSIILGIAALVLVPSCVSLFRSGKRGWGWVVLGIIAILVVFALKTTGKVLQSLPRGSRAGGFGGGFGGGFSGGGGATGSW